MVVKDAHTLVGKDGICLSVWKQGCSRAGFFSHFCDQTALRNSLKEEGFTLAHAFRGFVPRQERHSELHSSGNLGLGLFSSEWQRKTREPPG